MSSDPSPDPIDVFYQHKALSYVAAATASLLAYDIVLGLLDDIRILAARFPKLPDIIYLLSRTFAMGTVTASCLSASISPTSCNQRPALTVVAILGGFLIPCNSGLFLLRVRAIPPQFRSQTTLTVCTILWLSTFTSLLVLLGHKSAHCTTHHGKWEITIDASYDRWMIFSSYITLVVFDTATMVAIIVGFTTMYSPGSSWIARTKSTIMTKHMGHISGVFVRSGLIYYLATIGIHTSLAILVSMPSTIPIFVLGELGVLAAIFHNIMTCRVFRLLKLGALDKPGTTSSLPTDCLSAAEIVFRNTSDVSS